MNNKISIYLHGNTQEFIRHIVPDGEPLRPSYNINMLLGALSHIVDSSNEVRELSMDDWQYLVPIYEKIGIDKALASQQYRIAQDILGYYNSTQSKGLPRERLVRRLGVFDQAAQFAVLFTIQAMIAGTKPAA